MEMLSQGDIDFSERAIGTLEAARLIPRTATRGFLPWRFRTPAAGIISMVQSDGGLIARTPTDFEHNMIGLDLGQLRHQGHDVWLRYGLAEPDRNRHVDLKVKGAGRVDARLSHLIEMLD